MLTNRIAHAATYYSSAVSWTLYYLIASLQWPLPWAAEGCDAEDAACLADPDRVLPLHASSTYFGNTVLQSNPHSFERGVARSISGPLFGGAPLHAVRGPGCAVCGRITLLQDCSPAVTKRPCHIAMRVLSIPWSPVHALCLRGRGWLPADTFAALFLVWATTYFIIHKGARSVGAVVKCTVIIPWTLLLIMIIYNATLEGSREGIKAYIGTWDMSALQDGEAWSDAAGQVFFSISVTIGAHLPGLVHMAAFDEV